ncbi:MAG: hypothetical protein CM1200mP41_30160 [Gammaproteobacteria bacterium]|nr:MAG: hypothetical protein CM1200mP41_30160 [Gammaproteobacteria bacterium]
MGLPAERAIERPLCAEERWGFGRFPGTRKELCHRFKTVSYLVPELSALLPSLKAQLQQLSGRESIPQIEIASGTNVLAIIVRYLSSV